VSRQFDVHLSRFSEGLAGPPFLVNLQSDHLNPGPTLVAAPLWPMTARIAPTPVSVQVQFGGRGYWLVLTDIAYARVAELGRVGNLAEERDRIIRGLDLLFTGI
jgi:hypothetical protein